MFFSWIREQSYQPQLKWDKGRAGAWAGVGRCDRVHLDAGRHKDFPRAHPPFRTEPHPAPISSGPPGSTGSALAILVRDCSTSGMHHNHPALPWGSLAQQAWGKPVQLWMGVIFLRARPSLCLCLPHSPANPDRHILCNQSQPLSWAGNEPH